MFRLIGNVSKKVYYEAENASDLNKWRLDNFVKGSQADGHMVSQYDAPEVMVIVKAKTIKSKKEYLNDLLDEGKYEEYRRITMENSSRDIEVYGSGKDKPELIDRRKKVEELFRQGITNTAEIASRVQIARSTVNFDLRALRKTYPELRQKRSRS
jgi:DNA-binding NarL/FixJ family response regulator